MYRLILVLTLAFAVAATPAAAAQRTGTRDLAVVSGTSGGDEVQLFAQDTSEGGLCLDITVGGVTRMDALCARPATDPRGDLRPRLLVMGRTTVVYGAVSPQTRYLELTLSRGRPVRLGTERGRDYHGSHDVRFYAYSMPYNVVIAATRALSADGRALAATDLNELALPPLNGRATVRRLDDELGNRSRIVALDTMLLTPTAARPDLRRRGVCVGLQRSGLPPVAGRVVCTTSTRRLDVQFATNCTTHRSIFYGFTPGAVRRARAVLGDGSSRNMQLVKLPRRMHRSTHAMLLVLTGGTVDRIEGLGANGDVMATIELDGAGC